MPKEMSNKTASLLHLLYPFLSSFLSKMASPPSLAPSTREGNGTRELSSFCRKLKMDHRIGHSIESSNLASQKMRDFALVMANKFCFNSTALQYFGIVMHSLPSVSSVCHKLQHSRRPENVAKMALPRHSRNRQSRSVISARVNHEQRVQWRAHFYDRSTKGDADRARCDWPRWVSNDAL